jgi:glycosyltransferase involved in cell wall biosynthesis
MKNMRILLLIPNLGRGGAQQVFRDQLQFYSQHYTTIGCVFNWDEAFADDHQSHIHSLDIPAGTTWVTKFISFWRRVAALRKIKKKNHIDICISHLEGADYVNVLSKGREKTICWIHGSKSFDENISGVIGAFRKKIFIPFGYRLADQIVTVSEGIRQELISNFSLPSSKTRTLYNGFDLDEIDAKSAQPLSPPYQRLFDTKTILITHCRLSTQKNVNALIDIYKHLKDELDVKLVILGDGELREELIHHSRKGKLQVYARWESETPFHTNYNIYFLGYERNPYPFLQRSKLYLMTSSWEGFPLSLCEAMACNLPVLSSDCFTGPREIISPALEKEQPIEQSIICPYGILMPLATPSHLSAWLETIQSVLGNEGLQHQLKQAGRERVSTFDKRKISLQWLSLVEQFKNSTTSKSVDVPSKKA